MRDITYKSSNGRTLEIQLASDDSIDYTFYAPDGSDIDGGQVGENCESMSDADALRLVLNFAEIDFPGAVAIE